MLHHRVTDFERDVAQCEVGAASRIPEIGESGARQCQLDFRSELLSVLFVGGYLQEPIATSVCGVSSIHNVTCSPSFIPSRSLLELVR